MGATRYVIETGDLTKVYGARIRAVDRLNLAIRRGEVYGFLGPNGAGKTTTVEILEGFRERSAGDVTVLGFDPAERAKDLLSQGVPELNWKILSGPGPNGLFDQKKWRVNIYPSAFSERKVKTVGDLNQDEVREIVGTLYHESRHTDQDVLIVRDQQPLTGGRFMVCVDGSSYSYKAMKAALPAHHRWLEPALDEYIEEEAGHDEWILNDIAACGGDAEAVRHGRPSPATEIMVAYAYDTVQRGNPLGFFGMVHVLEGTSVSLALLAAVPGRRIFEARTTRLSLRLAPTLRQAQGRPEQRRGASAVEGPSFASVVAPFAISLIAVLAGWWASGLFTLGATQDLQAAGTDFSMNLLSLVNPGPVSFFLPGFRFVGA